MGAQQLQVPTAIRIRVAGAVGTDASPKTRDLLLQIDALKAETRRLRDELAALRVQASATQDDREQLRYLYQHERSRAERAEAANKAARARLLKSANTRLRVDEPAREKPVFADHEQGFRYLVLTHWATRTIPGEQPSRPMPDYQLGPKFLDSLSRLEGISEEKVADVVFEITTGIANQMTSREVHRLRSGQGANDPIRTKDDGAVAWRASLQMNTAAARRIHYWALPNGTIEFSRVTTHDDFEARNRRCVCRAARSPGSGQHPAPRRGVTLDSLYGAFADRVVGCGSHQ